MDTYSERLKKCALQSLTTRRKITDLCMMFNINNGNLPNFNCLSLKINRSNSSKRKYDFVETYSRTCQGRNEFSKRIIHPWNDLPTTAKTCTNIRTFKSCIMKHLV